MKREPDQRGDGGAGERGIARTRAAHELKGILELTDHRLLVHAFQHGLRTHLQQFRDAVQRAALDTHPVKLPRIAVMRAIEVRVMAVHPHEGPRADLVALATDLHPPAAFEAEDQLMTRIGLALDAMLKAEKDPRETGNAAIFDTYQYLGKRTGKGYAEWEARQKGLLPPEEPKKGKKGKKTEE